jgi:hypothetical protein
MQTGSPGTLIGWKSGQTIFVPLWTEWRERSCGLSVHCTVYIHVHNLIALPIYASTLTSYEMHLKVQ